MEIFIHYNSHYFEKFGHFLWKLPLLIVFNKQAKKLATLLKITLNSLSNNYSEHVRMDNFTNNYTE